VAFAWLFRGACWLLHVPSNEEMGELEEASVDHHSDKDKLETPSKNDWLIGWKEEEVSNCVPF
jgi:hypothetical protein